ncbi:branched-chain amino acid transport system II carrier protein [Marinobacterium jannaschii]|uniref:branched-chain amino acid transport system II carrier protein n=1 Tax=Marinobacterium jannaschii TaxID=64970 RepID=UPI0004871869|nr:branched-chain amino acid transport system II carrier protein [Marinobacterium jannaschii]
MNTRLNNADIFGLGFMTFAFFLGAGNIIFPPLAGLLAGDQVIPAMAGFLTTAVGLPLLGLFAVAKAGGGIPTMTRVLPGWIGALIAVSIFIIIGPLIAAPRTALVAFELGVQPFMAPDGGGQLFYSVLFFSIAMLLALFPGKLMDSVGKILTPVLILLLGVLAVSVFSGDAADWGTAAGKYAEGAYAEGFVEGYNTMDALASIMFGMLIIDLLKKKGVTTAAAQYRYLVIAAVIAAAGLAFVYISLFMLGAGYGSLAADAANGGQILTAYVESRFGMPGMLVLAAVITLACLTTAVGLLSACSDYFSSLTKSLSYSHFVMINSVACVAVANLDLSQLISLSIPLLVAVYPIAIALILFSLASGLMARPRLALTVVLLVSAAFGLLEGLKVAGLSLQTLAFLPLFDTGMAWVLPTLSVLLLFALLGRFSPKSAETA